MHFTCESLKFSEIVLGTYLMQTCLQSFYPPLLTVKLFSHPLLTNVLNMSQPLLTFSVYFITLFFSATPTLGQTSSLPTQFMYGIQPSHRRKLISIESSLCFFPFLNWHAFNKRCLVKPRKRNTLKMFCWLKSVPVSPQFKFDNKLQLSLFLSRSNFFRH